MAETKSSFESWNALFKAKIPKVQAITMLEGWMWRKQGSDWVQCYSLIYEGVLFFFENREIADKFKLIAARDEDAVFLASQLSEGLTVDCLGVRAFPPVLIGVYGRWSRFALFGDV